jgi:hypothetical protein
MIINRILTKIYGTNFPIYGGTGDSIDDAIIFHDNHCDDFVPIEYEVLRLLADLQDYKYEYLNQTLIKRGAQFYDRVKVKVTYDKSSAFSFKYYYFDISNCLKSYNNFYKP